MDYPLDHRIMAVPHLRLAYSVELDSGSTLLWEIRIGQPNVTRISPPVLHSLEHALIAYLRGKPGFIHAAPMGCATGLYLITSASVDLPHAAQLVAFGLNSLREANEVPLRDTMHCGAAAHHDLAGAQEVATWMLSRHDLWNRTTYAPPGRVAQDS